MNEHPQNNLDGDRRAVELRAPAGTSDHGSGRNSDRMPPDIDAFSRRFAEHSVLAAGVAVLSGEIEYLSPSIGRWLDGDAGDVRSVDLLIDRIAAGPSERERGMGYWRDGILSRSSAEPRPFGTRLKTSDGIREAVVYSVVVDTRVLSVVIDVTETLHASRLLESQRDLAVGLLACVDLPGCLDVLLKCATRLPGFDCGGMYLCDESTGALELAAHHGLSDEFVSKVRKYPADSPQARLVRAGTVVYGPNSDLPPEVAEMIASEGLEILAILPIHCRGKVIASLNVSSRLHSEINGNSRIALESLVAQAEGSISQIRANAAQRHAEMRLRLALEGAELGTWIADFETGRFETSEQALRLHGLPDDSVLTVESAMEPIHPEDRPMVAAALDRTIHRDEPFSCEYRLWMPGVAGRWIASQARFFERDGSRKLYGIVRDITHRKLTNASLLESRNVLESHVAQRTSELESANQALREESMRLKLALDASQAGTWSWKVGSSMADWDNRNRRLFGFDDNVPITVEAFNSRLHPDDRSQIIDRIAEIILPGSVAEWNNEFRINHPTLGVRWLAGLGRVDRDKAGNSTRISGINVDITERKKSEQAMREWNQTLERRVAERTVELLHSENRFRQLAEATFEGIAVSVNGVLVDGNPQLARICGYDLSEMIGRPILDFVAPESRALVADAIGKGIEITYESMGLRKDGSVFPMEVHGCMRTWHGQHTRVTAVRDLTEIRRSAARLQAQKTQLDEAQRLALVSEVSAGIVHQIGQPLAAIGANVAAGLVTCGRCEPLRCDFMKIMQEIEADVERMRDAVKHLHALADPDQPNRVAVDVNGLIEGVIRLLETEAEARNVAITVGLSNSLPQLDADAVQLSQVILNLIRNAFDACDSRPPEQRNVRVSSRMLTDGRIELSVCDSGTGITDEAAAQLFAPFFSTKAEGLGIGLRLSRTIVHAHGGSIEGFNNSDGPGATFRILLPTAPTPRNTKV